MTEYNSKTKQIREKKDEIIKKYNFGYTSRILAKEYDCSDTIILKILKENNIPIRKSRLTKKERDRFLVNFVYNYFTTKNDNFELTSREILKMLIDEQFGRINYYTPREISKLLKKDNRFDYRPISKMLYFSLK